jgi:hypothetical protein
MPVMTLSGVRISWDMVAKNCDLASLAACAWKERDGILVSMCVTWKRRAAWCISRVCDLQKAGLLVHQPCVCHLEEAGLLVHQAAHLRDVLPGG